MVKTCGLGVFSPLDLRLEAPYVQTIHWVGATTTTKLDLPDIYGLGGLYGPRFAVALNPTRVYTGVSLSEFSAHE